MRARAHASQWQTLALLCAVALALTAPGAVEAGYGQIESALRQFFGAAVNVTTVADGDVLTYSSAAGEWAAAASAAASAPSLQDVSDVGSSTTTGLSLTGANTFGAAGVTTTLAGTASVVVTDGVVSGMLSPVESVTAGVGAPNVLTADESGKVLNNTGATAEAYNTLPAAVAGLRFTLVVADADGARFTAPSGTIYLGPSSGTAVSSTTVGSSVTLVCDGTNWYATSGTGTWVAS
jgi:hypothetical protein